MRIFPSGTWTNLKGALRGACIFFLWSVLATEATAHKVNLFAYVEGDEIVVEGYFSGSAKAMNCLVDVFDSSGKKLLEGKTDAQGLYSFKISQLTPTKGDLRFVLHAGQGHMADYTLPAAELPRSPRDGASATQTEDKPPATQPVPVLPDVKNGGKEGYGTPPAPVDPVALKTVLDESLDAKIQPLIKMLGNQQKMLLEQKDKGPSVVEILGGIGWIFGLFGTAAYFASRNRGEKR